MPTDLRATALRAALAQQEEPVAYTTGLTWEPRQSEQMVKVTRSKQDRYGFTVPLWTSPPRREWQGLTEDDVRSLYGKDLNYRDGDYERYARAVEQALKEKNQ